MKIEAGKYYRTRCGRKAYVDVIFSPNPFSGRKPQVPVRGYIDALEYYWTSSGRISEDYASHADLVAEWIEPKTKTVTLYWTLHRDGSESCTPYQSGYMVQRVLAKKDITLTEGEGLR